MLTAIRPLAAAALAAAALAAPASASSTSCPGADVMPTPSNLRVAREATLCLLNHERAVHGLKRLRPSPKLRRAAAPYARKMVQGRFFEHVSPGGSTFIDRVASTGYLADTSGWSLGENLAWGSGPLATPGQIMEAWMGSAGHRRNILNARFADVGIGIATGAPVDVPAGTAAATYVTEFGARRQSRSRSASASTEAAFSSRSSAAR